MGIYIKNRLNFSVNQCSKNVLSNTEHLWVDILTNKNTVTIGVVCRHPGDSTAGIDRFTDELNELFLTLNNSKSPFYCVGDFNVNLMNVSTKHLVSRYANKLISCNSRCLIDVPTRIDQTCNTLLDHIFANDLTKPVFSGVLTNFDLSDHYSIFVIISKI